MAQLSQTARKLPRVFSGIQPTSDVPHLGNYIGAVKRWVEFQDPLKRAAFLNSDSNNENPIVAEGWKRDQLLFCIVDLHAITQPYDPKTMHGNIMDLAASFLGCGLDPNQCTLFQQSSVAQHSELSWILGSLTANSWLDRMTQFKQKKQQLAEKNSDAQSSLGLYGYPVLMAADILLYQTTHVPVGDDQRQHLELTRMICTTFNDRFKANFFEKPVGVIDSTPRHRIMSLTNPTKKMSKSDPSPKSRIGLTDTPDEIRTKIKKAQTDSIPGINFDPDNRPGVSNLISIYSAFSECSIDETAERYKDYNMGSFKGELIDLLVDRLCPLGERINHYRGSPEFLESVLEEGAMKASEIAQETMLDVKHVIGLSK